MEAEETRDYNEPCGHCSAVSWGITEEGRFYCTSCHTVTEKTKEVLSGEVTANARAQSISRGLKKRNKLDKGREWFICEGFQCILRKQAEALQSLGVSLQMKDVLYNFWSRYLQKNKYFCNLLSDVVQDTLSHTDSEAEIKFTQVNLTSSASDTDVISEFSIGAASSASKTSEFSIRKTAWSGSVDGSSYLLKSKKEDLSLSMPVTLAFCYLALLWLRESITLSDLLRLVMDGHIPYLNAFKDFPEEMKVYGSDLKIFHVQSWPNYDDIHKKMHALAEFLDLPFFPDITESSFLHPNNLCMKYLMEVNLPDDMNKWTCRVVKKIGVGEIDFLTLHPGNKSTWKVKYDILAIAVIIVVLKILFLLDDHYEWMLADSAEERNKKNKSYPIFDIREWYIIVKNTLDVEQKKFNEGRIRRLWRCEKPLVYSASTKCVIFKKKQIAMDLQRQFRILSGSMDLTEKQTSSLFQLNWMDEKTKRNCFHGHSLAAVLQQKGDIFKPLNKNYWLCSAKKCEKKACEYRGHYNESDYPHSYLFILDLFSFLLRVQSSLIHEEVSTIEHKLFYSKLHSKSKIIKVFGLKTRDYY